MPKARRNNGTPQAVDDLLVVEEIFSKSEFTDIGITSLDLTQNDRGGKSKTFLGLGELGGKSLVIEGVGEIEYDFEADSFSFKPAEGFEGGAVEFEYAIQMGNGVVSSATASFEATVQNEEEPLKEEILIDFNIVEGIDSVSLDEYEGFAWDKFFVPDGDRLVEFGNDLLAGPGDDVARNFVGETASIKSIDDKDFDFITGEFYTLSVDNEITIKAFDDGMQVGEATIFGNAFTVTTVNFLEQASDGSVALFTGTFESIDELNFSTPFGQFGMDDLLVAIEV